MHIKNIHSVFKGDLLIVIGLGEDNRVYVWEGERATWILLTNENAK